MSAVFYTLAWLLQLFWFVMVARVVMSLVLAFTQYRPSGAAAVVFEFVYSVTDPPVRFLRRFIPDLRLGNVGLDLAFLVLIIGVQILAGQLFAIAEG